MTSMYVGWPRSAEPPANELPVSVGSGARPKPPEPPVEDPAAVEPESDTAAPPSAES